MRVEIIGDALKRLPTQKPRIKGCKAFGGQRAKGRSKCEGWTRWNRATVRETLESHKTQFLSCAHFILPHDTTGKQAREIFRRIHRWFSGKIIGAFAIAETPNPHFHAALTIEYCEPLAAELRKVMAKWWNDVLHRQPTADALDWRHRDEPTEAIAKYLSKSSKGGRGVKGKASWLTFQPYFKTRLPRVEKQTTTITQTEAHAVLGPFRLTYGAGRRLIALRSALVSSEPPNPVVKTTFVATATHTPEMEMQRSSQMIHSNMKSTRPLQAFHCDAIWGKVSGTDYILYPRELPDGRIVFDDEKFGLVDEEFVEGADVFIKKFAPSLPCMMRVCTEPVCAGYDFSWLREENGWQVYHCRYGDSTIKLCPNFAHYYPKPPIMLYITLSRLAEDKGTGSKRLKK